MKGIVDYRIEQDGRIRVRLENGGERWATDKEWLSIWQQDPCVTVQLATH